MPTIPARTITAAAAMRTQLISDARHFPTYVVVGTTMRVTAPSGGVGSTVPTAAFSWAKTTAQVSSSSFNELPTTCPGVEGCEGATRNVPLPGPWITADRRFRRDEGTDSTRKRKRKRERKRECG